MSIGYCEEIDQAGPAGYYARRDGGYFEPTKLLYPVEQKNYTDDKFISGTIVTNKVARGKRGTFLSNLGEFQRTLQNENRL